MSKTVKIKGFLDSNVVIAYLQGKEETKTLFSDRVLAKAQYLISPIVYQEVLLFSNLMEKRDLIRTGATLDLIENLAKVVTIAEMKTKTDPKILRQLRNRMVHTNDIVILQAALNNCDYFLTFDRDLLRVKELVTLKIVTPVEFLRLLEENQ
jgi:predicted nucleic acid-binding protein